MRQLGDYLLADSVRAGVIADCAAVIEKHVARRSGLKGVGMRTGLKVVRTAKPDIIASGVGWLLPDFAVALDPQFQEAQQKQKLFPDIVLANQPRAVADILRIVDRRAKEVKSSTVKSIYHRLRGSAEEEVEQLLPSLVRALARHLPK